MLVGDTDALPYLVSDGQLLLECLIGVENVGRHSGCSSQGHHKGSDYLVKALVHIDTSCSDLSPSVLFEFEVGLGEVPTLLCPDTEPSGWPRDDTGQK